MSKRNTTLYCFPLLKVYTRRFDKLQPTTEQHWKLHFLKEPRKNNHRKERAHKIATKLILMQLWNPLHLKTQKKNKNKT